MSTDIIRTDRRKDGSNMTMTVEQIDKIKLMADTITRLYDAWSQMEYDNDIICTRLSLMDYGCIEDNGAYPGDVAESVLTDIKYNLDWYKQLCNPATADEYIETHMSEEDVIDLERHAYEIAMVSSIDFGVDPFVKEYILDFLTRCDARRDYLGDLIKCDYGLLHAWIYDKGDTTVDGYYPRVKKYVISRLHINADDYETYCKDDYDGSLPDDVEARCSEAKEYYDKVVHTLDNFYDQWDAEGWDYWYDSDLDWLVQTCAGACRFASECYKVLRDVSNNWTDKWWHDLGSECDNWTDKGWYGIENKYKSH